MYNVNLHRLLDGSWFKNHAMGSTTKAKSSSVYAVMVAQFILFPELE